MIQVGGRNAVLTVTNTAWKELTTTTTPLYGRKHIIVQNKSTSRVSISFDTTKVYKEGLELAPGNIIQIPAIEGVKIYARAKNTGGFRVLVMETA
jgi:hypothetical protein